MAKVFIICGHGAGDNGATGNGYTEAERVRTLGKRIKALGGGSVTLGDVNRDYYADNGISKLNISKDQQIVELHMDSDSSASPHGGHVVINEGLEPDKYDRALAELMKEMFPGRSELIKNRSDLANPKRAEVKGYGYRLLECGFITNKNDVKVFNSEMDKFAAGILECFGISSASTKKDGLADHADKAGNWYYYKDGKIAKNVTTVAKNKNGWFYVKNGKVDFSYTGVAKNDKGWWRIEKGKVNFDFTGFAENQNGWWYLKDGKVDFDLTDIIKGTVKGTTGWWLVEGGKVNFRTTVEKNKNGWWYVKDGMVDFDYDGIAENKNGVWYIDNGKVDFDYSGEKDITVTVKDGKVNL